MERFDLLDRDLGWVKEQPDVERTKAISADYIKAIEDRKTVLAVSPTHAEGLQITRTIRSELSKAGKLIGDEIKSTRFAARNLTLAERQDPRFYREGDVVEFHSQAKGFRPGAGFAVTAVGRSSIAAKDEKDRETILTLRLADRF